MLTVSALTLNILAASIWYVGGTVLLIKGSSLLLEAHSLRPGMYWIWIVIAAGLCFGGLKGKFIFSKTCQNNLVRIRSLDQPRVWQIFRPWFFVFLAVMITTGAILSRLAHDNYYFLIGVAILDFSIAIALLSSSYVFWKQKVFVK
ncbi:MAG: hypothetical protein ACUZ8I_05690 [Candidatus Scalindua sp.]